MNLIFIFSLPRSGSTLLQKIMNNHPQISTTNETWQLIPFGYCFKDNGIISEYSHKTFKKAHSDFINCLEEKKTTYYNNLNNFFINTFQKVRSYGQEKYFLEKTPRNYLIIPFIKKVFPDAKFIFLFRDPKNILKSIINTWGHGRLRYLHKHFVDLKGIHLLYDGYINNKNKSIALSYEELINNPSAEMKKICNYLDIEYSPHLLKNINSMETKGKRGDQKGRGLKKIIIPENDQLSLTLARYYIFKKYLRAVPKSFLKEFRYKDYKQLKFNDWNLIKNVNDVIDLITSYLILKLHLNLIFRPYVKNRYFE